MEKVLTIAVPAYNAEKTLDKCLSSFLEKKSLPKLEILVIDDGSTDTTGAIADRYAAEYPDSFRVIHKKNGGHGSGINRAAREARGKYFRVVDADDWILTEYLEEHLQELETTQADVVVHGFHRVREDSDRRVPVAVPDVLSGKEISLSELMKGFLSVRNCFTIHGICYRRDIYQGTELSEGIFYEDNEYTILPFQKVKTILFGKSFFYQYLVGRPGQSITDENQVKRLSHLDRVLWRLCGELNTGKVLADETREYFLQKLAQVVTTYMTVCLLRNRNRREGRRLAKKLEQRLANEVPALWEICKRTCQKCWILHRLHLKGSTLDKIQDSSLYQKVRDFTRKNK